MGLLLDCLWVCVRKEVSGFIVGLSVGVCKKGSQSIYCWIVCGCV